MFDNEDISLNREKIEEVVYATEDSNLPHDYIHQKHVDDKIGYTKDFGYTVEDSEELSKDSEEVSIEENTNNKVKKKQKFIKKEVPEEGKYPNNKKKKKKKNQNEKREKDNKNRKGKEGKEKKNDQDEKQGKEKNRNDQNENKKKTPMSNFNSFEVKLNKRANEQEPKKEKLDLNEQSQENEERTINSKQIRDGGVQNKENPVKKNPDNNQLFELPQFKSLEVESKNEKLNCFCDLKLKSVELPNKNVQIFYWPDKKKSFVNVFKFKVDTCRLFGFCFHKRDYYILEDLSKGSTKCKDYDNNLDIVYNEHIIKHEVGFFEKLMKHVGNDKIFKWLNPVNKKKEEDS